MTLCLAVLAAVLFLLSLSALRADGRTDAERYRDSVRYDVDDWRRFQRRAVQEYRREISE